MQQTTNYNFNLPEGTDIVNPLVDYNPNFSSIDGILKANADRTVGRATCIKSGTTHVVTRANTGSNIINFTATGDWNAGDTMTIDSVVVSVFLPDGSAALDGAYLINSEVFGILNGTRFTLYSNITELTAALTSYDNTSSGLTASNVQDAIDEISSDLDEISNNLVVPSGTTCIGTVIGQTEIFVPLDRIFLNKYNIIPTMVTYLDIPGGGTLTTLVSSVTEYMNGIIISFSTFDASSFIGHKSRANINFS